MILDFSEYYLQLIWPIVLKQTPVDNNGMYWQIDSHDRWQISRPNQVLMMGIRAVAPVKIVDSFDQAQYINGGQVVGSNGMILTHSS